MTLFLVRDALPDLERALKKYLESIESKRRDSGDAYLAAKRAIEKILKRILMAAYATGVESTHSERNYPSDLHALSDRPRPQ